MNKVDKEKIYTNKNVKNYRKNNLKYKNNTKTNIIEIIKILKNEFQNAKCGLDYNSPFELTVALILAAQCTDERVNKIRPLLFEKFKTMEDIANADIKEIEKIIKPCGFYVTKAKNIQKTAQKLIKDFNSVVPKTMKELCTLYGIARKSSNIILQECFNISVGIAVDTHVTRLSYRMGITDEISQNNIEIKMMKKIPKSYYMTLNHVFVLHGRKTCTARSPRCSECLVQSICTKNGIKKV